MNDATETTLLNGAHEEIGPRTTPSKPQHIVFQIAVIGLGTGALILGAIYLSLDRIRRNRVIGDQISAKVATSMSDADEYFSSTLALTSKLLDEDAAIESLKPEKWQPPLTSTEIDAGFEPLSARQIRRSNEQLQRALDHGRELHERCLEYRYEIDEVHGVAAQSKKHVDELLHKLRLVLDDNDGRELLDLAIQIRQYRDLPKNERAEPAMEILNGWSPRSQGTALQMELAELALLCEKLFSERDVDNLADIRENRLKPILSRMERLPGGGVDAEVEKTRGLLSQLKQLLFASEKGTQLASRDQSGSGSTPLFEACKELLEKRIEKKEYESQLRQCIAEFNSARSAYLDTFDRVSRKSTRNAVDYVEATSLKVGVVGVALSVVFLFFTVRASRLIRHQFRSIRETTEQLTEKTVALEASTEYLELVSLVAKHTDNLVLITNKHSKIIWVNDGFIRMTGYEMDEVVGESSLGFLDGPETDPQCFQLMKAAFEEQRGFDIETIHYRKNGMPFWVSIEAKPVWHQKDKECRFVIIKKDITARVEAEKEQHRLNELLMDASRRAGFAEMATGVLHNVGNVLNSVNVAAGVIQKVIRKSSLGTYGRLCEVVQDKSDDFAEFVANDPRGQHLPSLLLSLNCKMKREHDQCISEFDGLLANIEHIKAIISVQQTAAKSRGVVQNVRADELVNDSITANRGRLLNYGISITANVSSDLPEIVSDKHKILQILVNLIGNAKDSLIEAQVEEPQILVQAETTDAGVFFEVMDNGKGIDPAVLEKIFQHGFTTKKTGHGFGLHSSANAAAELGGSLSAFSEGHGHGATFRLFIPMKPPENFVSEADFASEASV